MPSTAGSSISFAFILKTQMANRIEIISTEVLSNNFFPLKKVKYKTENKDGGGEEINREVYMSANGATVLLYNLEKKTVILIRQFRLPTLLNNNEGGMMIETCAGIIENNDDPTSTIIREIEEETGFKVEKATKIFELYSTPGSVTEKLHYYYAEYTCNDKKSEGGGLDEEHEDIEVIELPFEEAFLKMERGEIMDAKTVILLQYARLNIFPEEKVFDML